MPELPDIVVYIEALHERILGHRLERVRLASPFLLRTVTPPVQELEGKRVEALRRIGKRIAIGFERDYWLVLHLMIAGACTGTSAARARRGTLRRGYRRAATSPPSISTQAVSCSRKRDRRSEPRFTWCKARTS